MKSTLLYLATRKAGTGKSTLIKYLIEALPNINPDKDVVYTSFTGKAVNVLRQKGNKNVLTLHKLLYTHKLTPKGVYIKTPVPSIKYKIVVIDEISMVSKDLLNDLMKYPVHVIACGDPGQLPPVSHDQDNHLLDRPHVFLDEIMRQAAESDIIKLTMAIREGKSIPYMETNEVIVANKNELSEGMLQWADIVLCATNKTRHSLNQQMRILNGMNPEVAVDEGEKLICLQNYWEIESIENGYPLINGCIGYASNVFEQNFYPPRGMKIHGNKIPIVTCDFTSEIDENFGVLDMDKSDFLYNKPYLTPQENYKLFKNDKLRNLIPKSFTYGYAVTGWKAQGSSWKKVLVYEENFPFDKEERKKFLYTACTRAEQKLVWIR